MHSGIITICKIYRTINYSTVKNTHMTIDHIAIWTYNLEGMRNFYMHYFDASSGHAYLTIRRNSGPIFSLSTEGVNLN